MAEYPRADPSGQTIYWAKQNIPLKFNPYAVDLTLKTEQTQVRVFVPCL